MSQNPPIAAESSQPDSVNRRPCRGAGPATGQLMGLCRFRRSLLLPMLIACCLLPASIDCQRAMEHLVSAGATIADANETRSALTLNAQGLTLSNDDGSTQLRVHGYLQADGRFFAANLQGEQHNTLLFRRVRPLVEGTLANRFEFRFMPDFGEGNTVIQEAYAETAIGPFARLRIGKFKTPIGLEVLRSDRDLTFAERSLASDLVPIRDLGALIEASFLQRAATLEFGYFSSALDGANANFEWRGDGEGVARAFLQPFLGSSSPIQNLGAGFSYSQGHRQNSLASLKTIGQATFFQFAPAAYADGPRRHLSPQGFYFFKSFGSMGEYIVSDQTVAVDSMRRLLSNRSWQVSASLVLTGERNSYEGIQPAHPFEPGAGLRHLGAWEIAFRHGAVRVDPKAFPNFASPLASAERASESAVGLNWYMNRYTKIVADYEYTAFRMHGGSIPTPSPERVAMTRIQFAL